MISSTAATRRSRFIKILLTGDVQLILWPRVFARCRRELGGQVVLARGAVSRRDGTTNLIVSGVDSLGVRVPMPAAHDWR